MYFRRFLDLASIRDARYTPQYQRLYSKRKETVERVFAGAKKSAVCAIRFTFDRLRGRRFASPSLFRI